MQICFSIWDVWGCLPFDLPTTHILSVFLLWPVAKLKSQLSVCQTELALPFCLSLKQWFLFSKAHSEMALFSDSHSVAPSTRACQEVRLPELELELVYTNSSEKYGCIIIEAVLMSHPCYGNHCMLGQLRWGVADETPSGDGVNVSVENVSGEWYRKKELLDGIESAQSKANKHESRGGDRDCCGCPTHKYRV